MRALCRVLVRLYPPAWRRRYQREFLDMLGEMPRATYQEVWDIQRGVLCAWGETVWHSPYGLEFTVASVLFLIGIVNAFVSRTDADTVWRSSAAFILLALGTLLACAATGFLATRRGESVWRSAAGGLLLTVSALVIPAAMLMAVSFAFESGASPLPFAQYPTARGPLHEPSLMAFFEEFKQSKEWYAHWGRSVGFSLMAALIGGTLVAWLAGCAQVLMRRLSPGRR